MPDITVTLYIDATPGSGRGRLTPGNANIFFVGGSYTRAEMADPEMQRRCVYKMVEGSSDIETEVAADIADVFTQRTGLGPVKYGDSSTTRAVIPDNPYVVARNLAANREYDGPVVCTEPYFMNNKIGLSAPAGRRLRRTKDFRRQKLRQYFPRICRLRRAGFGQGLCRFHRDRRRQQRSRRPRSQNSRSEGCTAVIPANIYFCR